MLRGGLNVSAEQVAEAAAFGDVVFVDAPSSLDRAAGPLHSLLLWWRCALLAWPRAALIGKADEDTWLHVRGIASLLTQALHASEHALRLGTRLGGRPPKLYWGVMETFSWEIRRREPTRWNYAFRSKGGAEPCEGAAAWQQRTTAEPGNGSRPEATLVGPFHFAKVFTMSSGMHSDASRLPPDPGGLLVASWWPPDACRWPLDDLLIWRPDDLLVASRSPGGLRIAV